MSDLPGIDLPDEFRKGIDFAVAVVEDRYRQMEAALSEIMNDPRAGAWAQMRARCGLAVDL